jgi:hypothetical protein
MPPRSWAEVADAALLPPDELLPELLDGGEQAATASVAAAATARHHDPAARDVRADRALICPSLAVLPDATGCECPTRTVWPGSDELGSFL